MAFKRQVHQEEAEEYAEKNSMGFIEVSPLVNFNISETFVELARMALKRNGMERLWRSNKGINWNDSISSFYIAMMLFFHYAFMYTNELLISLCRLQSLRYSMN